MRNIPRRFAKKKHVMIFIIIIIIIIIGKTALLSHSLPQKIVRFTLLWVSQ
jgi:hypothetical protein